MINLVPISQITEKAKTDKVHLAYLTRLRLLPQAIRKKIDDHIEGLYPETVLTRLEKIESLKNAGLTYSQIRFQLASEETRPQTNPYSSFLFLAIGIMLGFLLAGRTAIPAAPIDDSSRTMLQVVNKNVSAQDPIYLIAVPRQNFYRLGPTNINSLSQ